MRKKTRQVTEKTSALQRAIKALRIDDICFVGSNSTLLEKFEPKYDHRTLSLAYQSKNIVRGSEILLVEATDEDAEFFLFRVLVELGIRIGDKDEIDSENEKPEFLALVEAEIAAYYKIEDISIIEDSEALEAFALRNAPYNVWPYWREYLCSQLTRMNMPKITLPFMMKASNES